MIPLPNLGGAPQRVVTLTANPSLDRTAELAQLVPGEVQRMTGFQLDAGGKGVNVARALHSAGVPVTAVLPAGGLNGHELLRLLALEGLDVAAVAIEEPIRSNITIVERDGRTTKINEQGPDLASAVSRLHVTVMRAAAGADWVVLAGSLPPGTTPRLYTDLIHALQDAGVKVAVDCDGPILKDVIAAGPDLIKPNDEELAAAAGLPVDDPYTARAAISALQELGARAVLASLGAQGAVLVDDTGTHLAVGQAVLPRSTVGAGDATLAGFIAAGARGPQALRHAVAYGTAAVQLPGTQMPTPSDIDESTVALTAIATERTLP
ncbi:MAG: 1-phosphofructokinase [Solirubrobacteraceae bacterium]|nr:1-phosphofructokinase [Solirubrobacteraceae bacterium]